MKHKIGILMVTITLLLIAFTMSVKADCSTGDLNGDKLVNNYDVDVLVNMAKGLEPVDLCADFDGDGYIGPADISILTQKSKTEKNDSFIPVLEESGVKGDVNNDKKIDYKDNNIILEMAKGKVKATKSADVDGDGYIGPADISLTISYIKFGMDYGLVGKTYDINEPGEPFVYHLPHNPKCEKMTADLNNDYVIDELDEEVAREMVKGNENSSDCGDLDLDGFVSPVDLDRLTTTVMIDIPKYNITFEPNPELFNGECSPVIGDVNKDGKANYKDVGLIRKMILGTFPPIHCADFDKDGFVSPVDLNTAEMIEMGLAGCDITNNCTEPVNDTNQTNDTNETQPDPCESYTLPSNPVCSGLTGDLNKDGVIDALDIEVIQKMIAGNETSDICGDLDNDGVVAPGDYAELRLTISDVLRCNITFEPNQELLVNSYCECAVYGDVNLDGKANYQDVGLIQKMYVGTLPFSKCADVDGDGYAAPSDVSIAQLLAAGINRSIPAQYLEQCPAWNNQTNSTPGNETGDDDDQGEDNDDQGNQTNNNSTNSTNSTHGHSSGGGHSGSSSRGGTAVFKVYPELAENATEDQPVNATVVKITEKANATTEKQEEKIPEVVITGENQSVYKPSIWMIGAIIALVIASLGITGIYFSDTIRKKKAFA